MLSDKFRDTVKDNDNIYKIIQVKAGVSDPCFKEYSQGCSPFDAVKYIHALSS